MTVALVLTTCFLNYKQNTSLLIHISILSCEHRVQLVSSHYGLHSQSRLLKSWTTGIEGITQCSCSENWFGSDKVSLGLEHITLNKLDHLWSIIAYWKQKWYKISVTLYKIIGISSPLYRLHVWDLKKINNLKLTGF